MTTCFIECNYKRWETIERVSLRLLVLLLVKSETSVQISTLHCVQAEQ